MTPRRGWLVELTRQWGDPSVVIPGPMRLGGRNRSCWAWPRQGGNHSVILDAHAHKHVVTVYGPRLRAELTLFQPHPPTDEQVRALLVAAKWLP